MDEMSEVRPVRIVDSIAELLAGATDREALVASDGKSGNTLERVRIDGQPMVVKHLSYAGDWLMRVAGDRVFWPHRAAQAGLYDRVPDCIDHAVVAVALDGEGVTGEMAVLMRDVGDRLIPEGDELISVEQHRGFLTHMAAMHAAYWGWRDDLGLQTMAERLGMFSPAMIGPELEYDDVPVPVAVADQGWRKLPTVAPRLAEVVVPLLADPTALVAALAATPETFLQGDWKMGNLGWHPEGRTILLDWAYLGAGPSSMDLMWYLALNRTRLPDSKEQSIDTYRKALEAAGIDTEPWWERQLGLTTIAIMVMFGWEKAVGDPDELAWWDARVEESRRWLTT
jgi:hypothetical protein